MSLKPKPRPWKIAPEVDELQNNQSRLEELKQALGFSKITLQVLVQRGIDSVEAIQKYIHPKLKDLTSPQKIKDMDLAVERLSQARQAQESIRIFGDYDVDGTCGAALLVWVFQEFGLKADARQPDRFKDGYGLNVKAVEEASNDGATVLVSVDCGITNHEAADRARELGIDLIIVDHHQVDPKKSIPSAVAVIDPQREDCPSELKQLCGCGLAFYLAMALRTHGRTQGWFEDGELPNLKKHLDLVVLATAADMVPLIGDNRILVHHGMEALKNTIKPGFKSLLEVTGLCGRSVSPGHLGFVLGPRINASGRIQNASLALELLTTESEIKGVELAHQLDQINEERKNLQNQIWDEVKEKVEEKISEGKFENAIVVGSENWHEGVIGIVASRVTEHFRKPAIVISISEGKAKGSARSYGGKNVLQAMRDASRLLVGFGGHKHAAGLSLEAKDLDDFVAEYDQAVGQLPKKDSEDDPPLLLDGEVDFNELDFKTLSELERLAPFGIGNPEPVFQLEAQVRLQRILKGRHLKLNLSPVNGGAPPMDAIWFHAAEDEELVEKLDTKPVAKWAGVPELNRFRGRITPTFRIRDRHDLE